MHLKIKNWDIDATSSGLENIFQYSERRGNARTCFMVTFSYTDQQIQLEVMTKFQDTNEWQEDHEGRNRQFLKSFYICHPWFIYV